MSSIFPSIGNGGQVVRTAAGAAVPATGVSNAYVPPNTFTMSAAETLYGSDCSVCRVDLGMLNALASEELALAVAMTPTGTWDLGRVNNLAIAFAAYAATVTTALSGKLSSGASLAGLADDATYVRMTAAERTTLASVATVANNFKGTYSTLALLQAAVPTGASGNWAILTHGAGTPATTAIWDSDNSPAAWIDAGVAAPVVSVTASQISDASADGRSLITAANYAAMRGLLGYATVATTGAYADLTGRPTVGSMAALDANTAGLANGDYLRYNSTSSTFRVRHTDINPVGNVSGGFAPTLAAYDSHSYTLTAAGTLNAFTSCIPGDNGVIYITPAGFGLSVDTSVIKFSGGTPAFATTGTFGIAYQVISVSGTTATAVRAIYLPPFA